MICDITGIVFRQIKIAGGKRMIQIFSREKGKISAGTLLSEKSKSKSALSIRPFTYGQYSLDIKPANFIDIRSAETLDANYQLGENPDRFLEASYILEFTDKLLPEGKKETKIFDLLVLALKLLCARKENFKLITISFMIKVFQESGVFPTVFSSNFNDVELLSSLNFDILNIIEYLANNPLERMEKLTLESNNTEVIFSVLKEFSEIHLDIGQLKSDINLIC